MKYEYKIFNLKSDTDKFNAERAKKEEKHLGQYPLASWCDVLNVLGQSGWLVTCKITEASFLLVREVE